MHIRKKTHFTQKILFGLVNFTAFAAKAFAQETPAGQSSPPATAGDTVPKSFSVKQYLTVEGQNIENAIGPGVNPVGYYIVRLINILSLMIGSVAFLSIVIGGILLLSSGGKEQQITKGKDIIKYAIIGLVIAFSAYYITAYVQSTFYEYGTATTSP
jgi:hypothetical protein